MATYKTARKAKREVAESKMKLAYEQLGNFQNIMNSMSTLYNKLENYDGIISKDKLDSIANLINLEERLNLTEAQIKMVTKKYE